MNAGFCSAGMKRLGGVFLLYLFIFSLAGSQGKGKSGNPRNSSTQIASQSAPFSA